MCRLKEYIYNADRAALKYIKHSLESVILLSAALVIYIILCFNTIPSISYFKLIERAEEIYTSAIYSFFIAFLLGMFVDFAIKHDNLRDENDN